MYKLARQIVAVNRNTSRHYGKNVRRVLGVETSCDDTAIAVVDSLRNVLYLRTMNDNQTLATLGGICPNICAMKHRAYVEELIRDCVESCALRLSDLDAVAVSTRPGLIVSLKVGADKALGMAREYHLPLIPIHHIRAHAVVARLLRDDVSYPFLALLISGSNSLIAIVNGPERFQILGESLLKSPGDCLDKIARELRLSPEGPHYAGAIEKLAKSAEKDGHLTFPTNLPVTSGAQFHFGIIKGNYLSIIARHSPTADELPNFCASVQFTVMSHLCKKLDHALQFLDRNGRLSEFGEQPTLVVSGGVASNDYLVKCIRQLMFRYGFQTYAPPPTFCTDNGAMIAWLGVELLESGSTDIYEPDRLPNSIYLHDKSPIGDSLVDEVCQRRPSHKLNTRELHDAAMVQ